ncbi:MAG TPA: DUF1223 domain-containing protein [Micropepsaceae bacterium]|jgi:hypothetical protein|nr:DUF1223 domain-containing protein [Micropepsaceae bacterium]
MHDRRFSLGGSFVVALLLAGPAMAGQLAAPRPVVIELFTSQGCSDCPAADKILTDLSKRKDVIALSFPVTYWDMLGWRDTFATEANTQRQKSYARVMNRSGIYTPQMIVDGVLDVVGNQNDRVMEALAARSAEAANQANVPIAINVASGRVEIAIPAVRGKTKPLAAIWVMRTLSQATVNVEQGENRNHRLGYSNVVRDLQRAGEWNGGAMKINLPLNVGKAKQDGVAVILQEADYGRVIGAAVLPVPDQSAALTKANGQ